MPPLVLVVEDEAILGHCISQYLLHHGYATAVARSGEEGVRLMAEASAAVAIVDLKLPGMDGLEVLRRVREMSPATAVIMMTAQSSGASAVVARKRGAFDYLTKPLALEHLRTVVDKAVVHRRQSAEPSRASSPAKR
jgi:DNA-binding response OmpR family regulator